MNLFLLLMIIGVWMFFSWIVQAVQQAQKAANPPSTGPRQVTRSSVAQPQQTSAEPKSEPVPVEEKGDPGSRRRQRPSQRTSKKRAEARSGLTEKIRELNPQSVVMGVVMSEVLGPPRCLKGYRPPSQRAK